MINIYCYNWNLKLYPQGLIDSNCGYHAIKNGNSMLKILGEPLNYNNYINSIKNSNKFYYLKSNKYTDEQINLYNKIIKSNSLSKKDLYKIIRNANLDQNIFISYCDDNFPMFTENETNKIKKLLKKDSYKFCIIIFKKKLSIVKHWIPIVFHKINNKVYLHILDSYDMIWWGEKNLNKLVNYLYPEKNVYCIKEYNKGMSYYYLTKILHFIILVFVIYLFMDGLFYVKLR